MAQRDIDNKAGEVRALYISDPTGQQAVYQTKLAEAQALLAAPESAPGPHIAAESTRRGMTAAALAAEVAALGALWLQTVSPAIEAERVGSKQDITNAVDPAAVQAARAAGLAALSALAPY